MSRLHRHGNEPGDPTPHAAAKAVLCTIGIVALLVVRGAPAPDMASGTDGAAAATPAHHVVSLMENDGSEVRASTGGAAKEPRTH